MDCSKYHFHLYDVDECRYQKSVVMTKEEATDLNVRLARYSNLHQKWVTVTLSDLKGRHLAALRSICETLGPNGRPARCTCGKLITDSVHFTSEEFDALSPEAMLAL